MPKSRALEDVPDRVPEVPMSVVGRNKVQVDRAMIFAHCFGSDQNMWRVVTPAAPRERHSSHSSSGSPCGVSRSVATYLHEIFLAHSTRGSADNAAGNFSCLHGAKGQPFGSAALHALNIETAWILHFRPLSRHQPATFNILTMGR